jgi:hypothetical protein
MTDIDLDEDVKPSPDGTSTSAGTSTRKPMRKRAKTQEEKEARAQERVMRNRLAAQTSRQRKREYVSTMELENTRLKGKLSVLAKENKTLKADMQVLNKRLESMEQLFRYLAAPGTPLAILNTPTRNPSDMTNVETVLDVPPLSAHLLSPDTILSHLQQQDCTPSTSTTGEEASSEPRIPAVNVDQQRHSTTLSPSRNRLRHLSTQTVLFHQMNRLLQFAAQVATLQRTCSLRCLQLFSMTPLLNPLHLLTSTQQATLQPNPQVSQSSEQITVPPGAQSVAATERQAVLARICLMLVRTFAVSAAIVMAEAKESGAVSSFEQERLKEENAAAVRDRQAQQ